MLADRSSETTAIKLGREDKEAIERGENLTCKFLFDYAKIAETECNLGHPKVSNTTEKLFDNHFLVGRDNRTKLIFRVRDNAEPDSDQLKFSWYEPPKLDLMERGWYFETFPSIPVISWEQRERHYKGIEDYPEDERQFIEELDITIDKKNWERILLSDGIVTRWLFDRLQITYYDV